MARPIRSLRRSSLPALLLALVALLVAPSVASAADPIFQFTGRGNGHGLGMSQWGAKGMAEAGWDYKRILGHYYPGSWVSPWTGTTGIRVNLDPSVTPYTSKYLHSSWTLGPWHTGSQLRVTFGGNTYLGVANHVYRFEAQSTAIRIWDTTTNSQWPVGAVGVIPAGTTAVVDESAGDPILTKVFDPSGYGDVANKRYRGTLEVSNSGGKVKLVNALGVEGYIYGVIPLETGYTWGEATKAQAVAARGYALKSTGELYCTTYSQVYGGHNVEQALSNAAADVTRGEVVFANDPGPVPITTYFYSSSGGYTENNENVWGGTAKSYYRGVPDPYEYESGSKHFIWYDDGDFKGTPALTGPVLRARLSNAGIPVPATLTDVVVTKRGVSGRVLEMKLVGTGGDDKVLTSTYVSKFKNAMGWGDNWFYVTKFQWDTLNAQVAPGGAVTVPFHVSPAVTCDIKGVIKDGVDTGVTLHAVNGAGTLTITQPGSYWIDGLVYNRTNAAGRPDPTQGDLRGTAALFRDATNKLVVVPGTGPSGATALTIKSSATSVYRGKPFVLSGVLTPGVLGDPVVVYVKKPGKTYWSYSSKRLCYSAAAAGGANWWYRYTPTGSTSPRGTYYFKVAFSGDASRPACVSPNIVKVVVK